MSSRSPLENTDIELSTSTSFARRKAKDSAPFCIGVLADFSGRGNRGVCERDAQLAARRAILVDIDNLEELPQRLGCRLHVPLGLKNGPCIPIRFGKLTDFHPDQILEHSGIFRKLRMTRELLEDPATFDKAASQVRSWATSDLEAGRPEDRQAQSSSMQDESDSDTLERLLGKSPGLEQPSRTGNGSANIESLIREAVKPYIVPAPDPQQAELIAQVDRAIRGQMRALLHHGDFQQLEAAWRMLEFLVSRIETDETLKLYAIDISKGELMADLVSAPLESTGAYRLLVEQGVGVPGGESYAVLLCGHTFDQTADDIKLLHQLGRVAQALGAPLLAGAHSHFAGCSSIAATPDPRDWRWRPNPEVLELWKDLRCSPEASYIGLVLPRFLLRLPYGKDTDPVEQLDIEEFLPLAGHEQYLWGNSAALCACLLAKAFRESGWTLMRGLRCDLTGLPMHIYESDGDKRITPCSETILTEHAMEVLIEKGFMPVLSMKGQDAIRVPRFQSIAEPASPLAGPWR